MNPITPFIFFVAYSVIFTSCTNQQAQKNIPENDSDSIHESNPNLATDSEEQLGQYMTKMIEDSKGNLWFGTLDNGLALYDGKKLSYLTTEHGLIANSVVGIVEDDQGILWIATQSGLSKYDGQSFTNFTTKDGLIDNELKNIFIDSKGLFWIGTWRGISTFDGTKFTDFNVPRPNVELYDYQTRSDRITELKEDKEGNIWIGRDGYGVTKYDGKTFRHFTKRDGLISNAICDVQVDKKGDIWFATRITEEDHPDPNKRNGPGGLCRFDGNKFVEFPEIPGLSKSNVYSLFEDKDGNIWITAKEYGVYKYDGTTFTNYRRIESKDSPHFHGVSGFMQDSKGRMWLGCSGGLYRIEGDIMINVTKGGPWE